ncbi:MAG: S41 family peptidase [Gemmatimonadota bacterium]|nr:S41 family peptidase [Gemmatimonadota bacterium]
MRRLLFVLLVSFLLSASTSIAQTDRPDAWRADLATLVERLEARHPDPYHTVSESELRSRVEELDSRVPRLGDHQIVVELARITALVGDGHTGVFVPWDFEWGRFPLEVWNLDEGLLIAASGVGYESLPGARIVSIGDRPAEAVLARVDSLVPSDNRFGARGVRRFMVVPEVLNALGVIDGTGALPLVVESPAGNRRRVVVRGVAREAEIDWRWIRPEADLVRWLRHRDARYWFDPLPEARSVYVQYNDASWQDDEETLLAFGDRLVDHVLENDIERVIVDLRWNDGGSDRWTNILLHALIRIEHALGHPRTQDRDPGPPLFALIGPETFSAATSFALDLEEHTNAVFVGEPTGGRPVGYGGQSFIDLPRTGTRVRTSYRYQISSYPGDDRPALFPHVAAPPTIASYRENRDPALEATLEWREGGGIVERLEEAVEAGGVEAGRATWKAWRADPRNRWREPEGVLNGLGYRLLGRDRVDEAVAVFRINAEAHPRSANAHDSLGEALVRAGRIEAAIAAYERSLALDPGGALGDNARRVLAELRSRQ